MRVALRERTISRKNWNFFVVSSRQRVKSSAVLKVFFRSPRIYTFRRVSNVKLDVTDLTNTYEARELRIIYHNVTRCVRPCTRAQFPYTVYGTRIFFAPLFSKSYSRTDALLSTLRLRKRTENAFTRD